MIRSRGYYEQSGFNISLLGAIPDKHLAKMTGLSIDNVRDARRRHGIKSKFNPAKNIIDWTLVDEYLGSKSDPQIAKVFSVSVSSVHERRQKLGIAIKKTVKKCACGNDIVAGAGAHSKKYCSLNCSYAAKYARANNGHEDLAVAIRALRRSISNKRVKNVEVKQ